MPSWSPRRNLTVTIFPDDIADIVFQCDFKMQQRYPKAAIILLQPDDEIAVILTD
jgi:hypothetical protein